MEDANNSALPFPRETMTTSAIAPLESWKMVPESVTFRMSTLFMPRGPRFDLRLSRLMEPINNKLKCRLIQWSTWATWLESTLIMMIKNFSSLRFNRELWLVGWMQKIRLRYGCLSWHFTSLWLVNCFWSYDMDNVHNQYWISIIYFFFFAKFIF